MISISVDIGSMDDDDDIFEDTPLTNDENKENTEEEIQKRKDERAAKLGFYPQDEIIFNSLLPYSEHVDAESEALWKEIKTNLGKSVALKELRPGYVMWTGRLTK